MIKDLIKYTLRFFRTVWKNSSFAFRDYWWFLTKGYTYYDIMDIDDFILEKLSPMLKDFRDNTEAVPSDYYEKYGTEKSSEKWKSDLSKIINIIDYYLDGTDYPTEEKYRQEILKFFKKHFFNLWF